LVAVLNHDCLTGEARGSGYVVTRSKGPSDSSVHTTPTTVLIEHANDELAARGNDIGGSERRGLRTDVAWEPHKCTGCDQIQTPRTLPGETNHARVQPE
jgi:hypothetical protein